ncbi:hypothetical protein EII34_09135 [Arachnia propionica]|uniref:Uncharacterized protein n=1 Tax=Arachnia propionica TaxID=1750 RepID=A0A3P1T5W5_9ACTN|nr:NEW3 domain-containing protein [Arachnia propionica]RRD04698.1 hypothetical protein EII34_09135 [Arachnia propionica]
MTNHALDDYTLDTELGTLTGPRHRMRFHTATWTGGHTVVHDLDVLVDGQWRTLSSSATGPGDQWFVLAGADGNPDDYWDTMEVTAVQLPGFTRIDDTTAELSTAADSPVALTVRISLAGDHPVVTHTLTAPSDGHFIVAHQPFPEVDPDEVQEVLCGARQHARYIWDMQALSAQELFAPMTLIQVDRDGAPCTLGGFIPASSIEFTHERELGPTRQPYGMSLRGAARIIRPTVFSPQIGELSRMTVGEQRSFSTGICALPGTIVEAHEELLRDEYSFTAYRENIYDTSMTSTIHNLWDLVLTGAGDVADTDAPFSPSPSGWWPKAKGFVDVEQDQRVQTTTTAVLLGAYLLGAPEELYRDRALPTIEFHLSRRTSSWSPDPARTKVNQMGGVAFQNSPASLHVATRRQFPALATLAVQQLREQPRQREDGYRIRALLHAAAVTGNPAHTHELAAVAAWYAETFIDVAYTTNLPEEEFQIWFSKAWVELLAAYEVLGDPNLLKAARREARRFITQIHTRPVPDIEVTVPNQPPIREQTERWSTPVIHDHPEHDHPQETVPAWLVSTNGMSFEQLTTYKTWTENNVGLNGFSLIPAWSASLLRLGHLTHDDLLQDFAHNLVVGRYTNYPGYYDRQFRVRHMKPDYPLVMDLGVSTTYYHHIPAQLGMTIDYLVTEHHVRSDGQVFFPGAFESTYAFFKFHTYGHEPGTFHGEDGVWPCLAKDLITVDDPQVNWLAGLGNDSLYLSFTNESTTGRRFTVRLGEQVRAASTGRLRGTIPGLRGRRGRVWIHRDTFRMTIPGRGHTSVIIRGVPDVLAQRHREPLPDTRSSSSFHLDDESPIGVVRGMLLTRPDGSGHDAFVQAATTGPATLVHSSGGEEVSLESAHHPNEWTVPVDDVDAPFTYRVQTDGGATTPVTLRLSPVMTGTLPEGDVAHVDLVAPYDVVAGERARLQVRVLASHTVPEEVGVTVRAPDGWQVVETRALPGLSPGSRAEALFEVTVPEDATPGDRGELTAVLTHSTGEVVGEPVAVEVLAPVKTFVLRPEPITTPGAVIGAEVGIVNLSSRQQASEVRLWIPLGWSVVDSDLTYDLAPGAWTRLPLRIEVAADAIPGKTYLMRARATADSPDVFAQLRVPPRRLVTGHDRLVTNRDSAPAYLETPAYYWLPSGLPGWDGDRTRYGRIDRTGGAAIWTPDLEVAGDYEVAIWYPSNPETATRAVYVVDHADGRQEFVVNQQENPSSWVVLGTFRFEAGTTGRVRLECREEGYHRANAVWFRHKG